MSNAELYEDMLACDDEDYKNPRVNKTSKREKLKLKIKTKSKDRVKISFDCTMENYSHLVDITNKTGYNRNELINILLAFGIENLEIEE